MNDQLNERIISSLDKITEYVETAEGFAAEQAPLVVEEIVRW